MITTSTKTKVAHRHNGNGRKPVARRAKEKARWVYLFADGNAQMRDLLGGKGANLAEITRIGMPVPPGFIVTTKACNAYLAAGPSGKFPPGLWEQELAALKQIEKL